MGPVSDAVAVPRGLKSPSMLLVFGSLLLTSSVIGLASVQYFTPPSFDNPPAVNQAGFVHFRSVISAVHDTSVSVPAFVWIFRVLLVGIFSAKAARQIQLAVRVSF